MSKEDEELKNTFCAECELNKSMVFHMAHKLNAVLGLNKQELEWLESLGAKVEREDDI